VDKPMAAEHASSMNALTESTRDLLDVLSGGIA
jgi:hypothetical protein